MTPPLVEPSRAAHASLGGYLYQVYLGVERWLDLGPDEVLRCEGDEDLDRLLLDGSGGVSEQVKALTGKINLRDEVMKGTLRRFVVSHHVLRTGTPPDERRFVFTSTAKRRRQEVDSDLPVDLLEVWEVAKTAEEVRAKMVVALHTLLRFPEPDPAKHPNQHLFWQKLESSVAWLDAEPRWWGDLINSIRWELEASDRQDVKGRVLARLRELRAPVGFLDRLVGEILEASIAPEPEDRLRTQEDLKSLLAGAEGELARWAATDRGRHLLCALGELDRLGRVLYEKASELPPNPSPGRLLSATYEVIPFEEEGRREVLADLAGWCAAGEREGVCLLFGEGGAGKTRLLMEFCHRLGAQGWRAGFLEPTAREDELAELLEGEIPRLAVLDYAESHLEMGRFLVSRLAHRAGGPKVRVVFLARRQEDWWGTLARDDASRDLLARTPPRPVEDLFAGEEGRKIAFTAAAWAFASHLGRELPAELSLPALHNEDFGRPLVLHMAAFLAAFGQPAGSLGEVLTEILEHERRYWTWMIEDLSLNGEEQAEVREALERAAVLLTLLGGAPEEDAARELARQALPAGVVDGRVETLFKLLRSLYGTAADNGRFLQGLEPDLLGEELVRQGLSKKPALLSYTLALATDLGRQQLLTVLARLAQKPESAAAAKGWLQQVFTEALETLAEVALDVAVAQEDPIGALLAPILQERASDELTERVMDRCDQPDFQWSTPLREVALAATERRLVAARKRLLDPLWLVRWWRSHFPKEENIRDCCELARIASNLSLRRKLLGLHEEALGAAQEALFLYRWLAKQRPEAFRSYHARSFLNLGNMHSDLGHNAEALEATKKAVALYRRLVEQSPREYTIDLAGSLNNLGNRLRILGQNTAALEAAQESTELYHQVGAPFILGLRLNQAVMQTELGQTEAALETIQEAVNVTRSLAEQRPDIFLPDLALGLNYFAATLNDQDAALQANQEAVSIYRYLANNRQEFLPDLAKSLNNLGAQWSQIGQREEALRTLQEAHGLYQRIANIWPSVFLSEHALSFYNLGKARSALEQWEEALEATQKAIMLYWRIASKRPHTFLPDLARSLYSLSVIHSALDQQELADEAAQEAIWVLYPQFLYTPAAYWKLMRPFIDNYKKIAAAPTSTTVGCEARAGYLAIIEEELTAQESKARLKWFMEVTSHWANN